MKQWSFILGVLQESSQVSKAVKKFPCQSLFFSVSMKIIIIQNTVEISDQKEQHQNKIKKNDEHL